MIAAKMFNNKYLQNCRRGTVKQAGCCAVQRDHGKKKRATLFGKGVETADYKVNWNFGIYSVSLKVVYKVEGQNELVR